MLLLLNHLAEAGNMPILLSLEEGLLLRALFLYFLILLLILPHIKDLLSYLSPLEEVFCLYLLPQFCLRSPKDSELASSICLGDLKIFVHVVINPQKTTKIFQFQLHPLGFCHLSSFDSSINILSSMTHFPSSIRILLTAFSPCPLLSLS